MSFDKWAERVFGKNFKDEDSITYNRMSAAWDAGIEDYKSALSKPAIKRFIPPTIEQVREYCNEIGSGIDPEYFLDSNIAKGWVIGKNKTPAKCWKAMVRTWEKARRENVQTTGGGRPRSFADQERDKHSQAKRDADRLLGIRRGCFGPAGDANPTADNRSRAKSILDRKVIPCSEVEITSIK